MLDMIRLLLGISMTGFGSLLGGLSQQLFYSTGIAGNIFAAICLFIVVLVVSLVLRNFGLVVIGVPLIILAYIFLKNVIPVVILVWALYMIIQTRRGKVF
ncbi:hypothetical protein [Enterococcus hulanensis]|uniref:hypothetical protein n=1 Tax=Enterococcus hulanensis TaxID=2559929 RepID=UPI0010F8631C|nr:hypothetical protein [Enterococcus hulanensis]